MRSRPPVSPMAPGTAPQTTRRQQPTASTSWRWRSMFDGRQPRHSFSPPDLILWVLGLGPRLDPLLEPPEGPGDDHLHRVTADEAGDGEAGIDLEVVGDGRRVAPRGSWGEEVGTLDQLHVAAGLAFPGQAALGIAVGKDVADRLDLGVQFERCPGGPALVVTVEDRGLLELVHPLGERVDIGHHLEDRIGRGLYFYGLAT